MSDSREPKEEQRPLQNAQINRALGVFLLFFAGIVLFAIPFTQTGIGKAVNLAAAGVIGLIGATFIYAARASKWQQKR